MRKCVICGYNKTDVVFREKKYSVHQCSRCKFGLLKPYPTLNGTKDIYEESYYDDKRSEAYLEDAKKKLNIVRSFVFSGARILDYGCAVGDFLQVAKDFKFDPVGYDISDFAVDYVRKEKGINAFSGSLKASLFKKNSFDAIVMFDVIEHIPNFNEVLDLFFIWLKSGGYLFLTTPNMESWDAKLFGKKWYGYTRIPQHINYFSPDSIQSTLSESNFTVVSMKTWGFVRSVSYLFSQVYKEDSVSKKFFSRVLRWMRLMDVNVYLPMVDMMVVARKV